MINVLSPKIPFFTFISFYNMGRNVIKTGSLLHRFRFVNGSSFDDTSLRLVCLVADDFCLILWWVD